MDSFLQQTARSIIGTIDWQQLSRTTLVLPSHRAGLVLKDELLRLQQERHQQAVWAPQVCTLPQLQDSLSPLYPEDELFTIIRLYKHYLSFPFSQSSPVPLDVFYGWGRQMLADFTNIDASMSAEEVPAFFANTIAAHELEQWKLDADTEDRLRKLIGSLPGESKPGSIKSQYEIVWRSLYDLYRLLHSEMEAEQKGYPGMRQRAVIEHWEDVSVQEKIAGRTFVFVGFNYLLPVERELMERLRDAGIARFYWDYVADFATNEKAFSFTKLNSGILGNALPPRQWEQPREVKIVSCVSREAQAQYVHRWLQENYRAKGQRVGVVICDETMLEPVIYTLPEIILDGETSPAPVNITKGFPLRNTRIYAEVTSYLNDRSHGEADSVVTPEIIDDLLASLIPLKAEEEESPAPVDAASLSWQELLVLESEYQVRKILNQIRKLISDGIGLPFTLRLLRLLARRMMESVTMPFHGEPVTDIQVMGVLETRMLDFDRLLLLNVEEGVVPQRQHDESFIPFYLRKAYHMQTSDERATVYAYNFFRLLSRAGHTTLLFASAETAEGGKGMSRFIMQMLVSLEFHVEKGRLQERSVLEVDTFRNQLGNNGVSLLSLLTKDEAGVLHKTDGRRYKLSPSALNTFISCPRSFYLRYIENLAPAEEEDVFLAPNTLGSLVHHTAEYIYRVFLGCTGDAPVKMDPERIESVRTDTDCLDQALHAAYAAMEMEWEDRPENIVILRYVDAILARDREDAKIGLQIYLLEAERSFPIAIGDDGEILVGGSIDRLDIFGPEGNQTLRVIDYKTGAYSDTTRTKKMSSSWDDLLTSDEKGYLRQTLIYSAAVAAHDHTSLPIEPNLFFCRKNLVELDTTVAVEAEPIHDYRAIADRFIEALHPAIHSLLTTTSFPPCEEDKCPAYCPFADLCNRSVSE